MLTKIIFLAVALAAATAQDHHHQQGHDHGHAYSSQSIVLHHSGPAHNEESHQGHHGHFVELQHGHPENLHGHHEQSHQNYYSHHEEQDHGHQEEYHGHHGVSSQNILLHNDGEATKHVEYYGHPKYEFAYEVKDPHTHDIKHQQESRDGDLVKGVYSLHQPDGRVRVVNYHADKKNGFNADVKYEGHAVHAEPEHKQHHH